MLKHTSFAFIAGFALVSPTVADVDYQCMSDCTARGYLYAYCQNVCSYPGINDQIRAQPSSRSFDLGRALLQAEQIRQLQLENERRAEELRRAQEHAAVAATAEDAARTPAATADKTMQPSAVDAAILQKFDQAIRYRRYRWKDFDQVVFAPDVSISMDMVGLMAESPIAADIAYYLGTHKDDAARISALPLPTAAREIFAIEEKLQATQMPAQ